MWTRRVILATMVAAAAMTLTRHVPASGDGARSAFQGLMVTAER